MQTPFVTDRDRVANVSRISWMLVLACLFTLQVGCQWTPKSKDWSWPWKSKDKEKEIPDRIMPIWTDTVLHQPGKPGLRGFGGRIFFYKEKNTTPIEIDGGLAVYVFDTDKIDPSQPQPEKKFVFTPEQFETHLSHSNMGPSYSIWIPWDPVGGPSQKLSLVARFEGRNGGTIISDPTIKLLPGVAKMATSDTSQAAASATAASSSAMRTASFSNAAEGNQEKSGSSEGSTTQGVEESRRTQTIDVPPSFQRHLNPPAKSRPTPGTLRSDFGTSMNSAPSHSSPAETIANDSDTEVSNEHAVVAASHSSMGVPEVPQPVATAIETQVIDSRTHPGWRRTGQGYNSRFQASLKNPGAPNEDSETNQAIELTNNRSQVPATGTSHVQDARGMRSTQVTSRMFRDHPSVGGWIESLPRTPRR